MNPAITETFRGYPQNPPTLKDVKDALQKTEEAREGYAVAEPTALERMVGDLPKFHISDPKKTTAIIQAQVTERVKKQNPKTSGKRRYLWEKQHGLCAYCDIALETPDHGTLDHIKPKSKGGTNGIRNLALCCPPCNALKAWFSSYGEVKEFADKLVAFFERIRDKGYVK